MPPGSGVFGYGTDGLSVTGVAVYNDGGYGISRYVSTQTVFTDDSAAGNAEAGFYVGDSPDADAVVSDDSSWNNGVRVFARHAHEVTVSDNEIWSNCVGVFLFDDGQRGGAGDAKVTDNDGDNNNHGGTGVSGGIVVFSAHQIDGGSNPVDDSIVGNGATGNAPADIGWDGSGTGNTFSDNDCNTSQPAGLRD